MSAIAFVQTRTVNEVMMNHQNDYSMIITTCADSAAARTLARMLIEKKLAACAQMLPIESIYLWKGEVCEDSETALLIKTKTELFDEIAAAIRENHPYEVPEIIQIPISDGLPEYLSWIDDCTRRE